MEYLDSLNKEQRAAVIADDGPIMVIAGPGSGKTRVLTLRIAYLMEQGLDPFSILALTFTNKAAGEMKTRIERIVGSEARNLFIGTFHSVFARILRIEAEKLGYPYNYTIYDTSDSKSLLKGLIKEENLPDDLYKVNMVQYRISMAKNSLISPKEYKDNIDIQTEDEVSNRPKIGELYALYNKRCFKAGAMDFDDLLFNMYKLLSKFPEALHKYQHQFKSILVDEFQDTNHSQYAIVKKLAAVFENVFVVGDDAQSIYSFRGANIKNMLNFESDYPDRKVFKLEQNYRSTNNIVEAANQLIGYNKMQLAKKIWTENETGEKIKVIKSFTDGDEGKTIATGVFEEKMRSKALNSDFAILYRTNMQSRSFEEALRKLNLPYRVYGGISFYQRKEVKDLIAYLRVTINPHDEEAIKRIINYPARGIGKTTIQKIIVLANINDKSLWDIINNLSDYQDVDHALQIQNRARLILENFATMIRSFMTLLLTQDAYEIANHIGRTSGIVKDLNNDKSIEGVNRFENLQELLNSIKEFTEYRPENQETKAEISDLARYLQEISLITSMDEDDSDNDKVSLMTLHAAKGLEFKYVYLVGLEENLFPSHMSSGTREELEEERRLFYVGITRAELKVSLSYALNRYRFGTLISAEPSRFIFEIEPSILDMPTYQSPPKKSNKQKAQKISTMKVRAAEVKMIEDDDFAADDTSNLQVGMKVKHNRFGTGKVVHIEGNLENLIATIFFPNLGQKKIMLKYAKLKVL